MAESAEQSIKSLHKAVKDARNELAKLERGTEDYNKALDKLAESQNKLNQINADARAATQNLTDLYSNASSAVAGFAGGVQAAAGTMELFGIQTDSVGESLVRLQALQGVVSGFTSLSQGIKAAGTALRGLNLTFLASPIGLIITAVALLIGYFTDTFEELWGAITDLFPALKDTSAVLDTITQVVAGVGTAIIRLSTGPLKVLVKVLKGDLVGAWDEVKNAINVVQNFDDGYTQRAIQNAENRANAALKEANQRLKYAIDENEARYGSDWKYTQDGRKAYQEYYAGLLGMYEEDSDDYRKAMNQKLTYDREYANKRNEAYKQILKQQKEYDDALQGSIDGFWKNVNQKIDDYRREQANSARQSLTDALGTIGALAEQFENSGLDDLEFPIFTAFNQWTSQEAIDERRLAYQEEIDRLWELAYSTEESADVRRVAFQRVLAARKEFTEFDEKANQAEIKREKAKEKVQQTTFRAYASILSDTAGLLAENTVASKILSVASATIGAWAGASQTLGDPELPFYAKLPAALTILTTGLQAVKNIASTDVPGASDSKTVPSTPTIPSFPQRREPINESYVNTESFDEDFYNNMRSVLVVEDLEQVAGRVNVTEEEAKYIYL